MHRREDDTKELHRWLNSHLLYERSCSRPCLFSFCCVFTQKEAGKKPMSKCKDQYDLAHEGKNGIGMINPKLVSTHLHTHMHSWWPTSSLSRQIRRTDDTFSYTLFTCFYLYTHTHTTPPAFSLCKQMWPFEIWVCFMNDWLFNRV